MKEKPLTEFINVNGEKERQKEIKGLWELPEGWKWVKLGYTAKIIMGQSPPSKTYNTKGIGLPFYQGKADFGEVHPVPKIWCSQPIKIAEKGDILISVRAPVGPVNIANEKCAIGRGLASIRPNKDFLNNWFLFYYLKYFEDKWIGFGSTFDAIRRRELQNLLVPLPPLEEQKRIVKKLDEIRSRVKEAKKLAREAKERAKELMASALHEIFSKVGERNWEWVKLEEIAEIIMGQSPSSKTYNTEGIGLPFYQGSADFGELYPAPRVWCTAPLKIAEKGDILISVRAPVGPVNIAKERCGIGRGLAAIRVVDKNILPKFVFYFLRFFEDRWTGFGSTFDAIRKKELINFPIPFPFHNGIPDIEEQKRIVAYLDAVSECARQLIKLYEEREKELEKLWFSALDKAFKGKL